MCGIIGIVSQEYVSSKEILKALKRLEYRGYDSVGYALNDGTVEKDTGEISDFMRRTKEKNFRTGIAHTRWATHGGVTRENAHPHTDCSGDIMIVHNGIIENYLEMKNKLLEKGHKFRSETDSEVIAHYFEDKLNNMDLKDAITDFIKEAKGTFAVLMIKKGEDRIYAFKRDSPLVLGIGEKEFYLSSDIYGFSDKTDRAIFFNDDEFAVIDKSYKFYDKDGNEIKKEVKRFQWGFSEEEKETYDHYMIKEIKEEGKAVRRIINSLNNEQHEKILKLNKMIKKAKKVAFVASGTSYFAALLGVYFLNRVDVESQAIIASEFRHFIRVDENTLVIAISQSGETMDVLKALKFAKEKKAKIVSIVNVPHSSIQRISDLSLEILAGQEICVAATKTFINQVSLLLYLANLNGLNVNLNNLHRRIQETIDNNESKVRQLAKTLYRERDIYVLGRGLTYPIAREIALKLKEISYIHGEGMMGGELKHGTLALIEKGTPVISLIQHEDYEMLSNTKEVEARGARVIKISNDEKINPDFYLKTSKDEKFAIAATIIGQLLAYYIAKEKGLPIDKPRNLAKSVTVE
ncbi:MAG: glutamine--fructose-6-phosphate transaminase (isomerizing) [Methanomicrobia archaeon]|nr:glutamine--fructose-6-phosphate transaminase (isomerizing) [Methanomicrobia archaeon]